MAIIDIVGFRHGETPANALGNLQGCGYDFDLNDIGIAQADSLAEPIIKLCNAYDWIDVLTSDLLRAKNTMKRIHEKFPDALSKKVRRYEIAQALRERNFGHLEGKNNALFKTHQGYLTYKKLGTVQDRLHFCIEEGVEIDFEVIKRVRTKVQEVLVANKDSPGRGVLLLSTHGNALRTALSVIFNNVDYPPLKNCEHVVVPVLEWDRILLAA